jgi:Gram-negative bacterial TonB protein C-terminal
MRSAFIGGLSFLRPVWPALIALAGLASGSAAPALGADDQQQRGTALIVRAAQLENLLSPDVGRFRLRVHVKLFGLVSGTREGDVLLLAASSSQWFEVVRFPGYTETTGLNDGQRWRKRASIDQPYRFHEVSQLLDLGSHLTLAPNAEVKSITQQTVAGRPTFCVEVGPTAALWQHDVAGRAAVSEVARWKDSRATLCFDAGSGVLLSAGYGKELPRFEYEDHVTLGAKAYPKTMRCFEGKELVVEATVVELVADSGPQTEGGFAAAAGAERWPECEAPTPPRPIAKRDAGVDDYAKARRRFGTVIARAEVGTDGLIHDLTFVQARGGLNSNVEKAVKEWRYAPAMCNGVPVPSEIYLAYAFMP